MSTIYKYKEIRQTYPEMKKCFFAFNHLQWEAGIIESGISTNEKICSTNGGLYGTKGGIINYLAGLDRITARIPKECDPQEVYDYEFDNHECVYMCDDRDAIKIVTVYFGEDIAKTIKRRCAIADINKLF